MKILVFIAIGFAAIAFIKFIVKAVMAAGEGGNFSQDERIRMQHGFKGRVRVRMETLEDGSEIEVLEAQIKGIIVGQYEHWNGNLRVGVSDITESRDGAYPVLCVIDAFQRPETCVFEFMSEPQHMGEIAYIESWMTLFHVPTDALQFARKGRRKLLFYFGVTDEQCQQLPGNYDEVEVEHDVKEPGFVELDDIQREVDRLTVQLAVLVSAADGELDQTEGAVVQNWIKKRLSVETDVQRIDQIKRELNTAVQEAAQLQDDPAGSVATICATITKKGVTAHKYDALELCLEVAGADGTADKSELDIIEEIARGLEIDAQRVNNMIQKALPVAMFADKDPDSVLGITSDMEPQQVRKLLNNEYRKWNSRVNHSDKKIREQAGEMLALIADARRRHVG